MFYLISIISNAKYKHYFRNHTYSALNVERKQNLNHQKSIPPEGERNSSDKSKQNRAKTQTSTTKKSALNKSIAPPTVITHGKDSSGQTCDLTSSPQPPPQGSLSKVAPLSPMTISQHSDSTLLSDLCLNYQDRIEI
jgi:hypothetical protein